MGALPLGGQSVPLPPGRWLAIAVANPTDAKPSTLPSATAFLGLIQAGRLVAAAVVGGTLEADPNGAGFAAPLDAQNPAYYYKRVISAVDFGRLDFWVCGLTQPARWADPLRQAAQQFLRKQGLPLPERLDSAVFRLADKRNWVMAEFMFPDPSPAAAESVLPWTELAELPDAEMVPHLEKVRRWGKAWHEIVLRGFNGPPPGAEDGRIPLP